MRQRKAEAWAKWRGLVAEQSQSGQSVSGFCSERGLRSGQLFAWKKRLREAEAAKFVAVEVAPVRETKCPAAVVHSEAIEVRLGRGRSLMVEPGFDAHHLRALLSVLEAEA
jgi:transposase-like protein